MLREISIGLTRFAIIIILIIASAAECAVMSRGQKLDSKYLATQPDGYVEELMRIAKAGDMINYMDENEDPCLNFYKFACGNWAKINPANSIDHLTTGLLEKMTSNLDRKLEDMLKRVDNAVDTDIDSMVKRFYKSCTRIENLFNEYPKRLKDIISEFGEMPALSGENWQAEKFDWVNVTGHIAHKYGIFTLLSVELMPDFVDNKINRIYLGQQNFLLEARPMYMEDHTEIYRDAYRSKIKRQLVNFLGIKPKLANVTANEIVEFEISLAQGMTDETLGQSIDELTTLTTIEELQESYAPTIDMARLLNLMLGESLTEPLYEYNEKFQMNLVRVLKATPPRILANYVFFNLVQTFMKKPAKTGTAQDAACVKVTKEYFAKNLDNMIYRRYSTNQTEIDIELIWNEMKATFKAALQSNQLNWIADPVRKYAIKKLEAMKLEINSYAKENFTEEFGELKLNDYDFVANVLSILQLASKRLRDDLHKPPKPLEAGELLSYTPANIIMENKIKVPVSLLQPYFLWAASYPNALKFGSLASLIGHELIHGFDDSGRKFDKDGNSYDWWDAQSTAAFVSRTQCFVKQYSRYFYNGRPLPRSLLQSENIADNGGIRLAYAAYLSWYEDAVRKGQNLRLEMLPSMNYTSKQLFFISYAQVWCNDAHPRVRDLQTSTDQHVPGKFRVIGPLANFPEFAKEFNCAAGTAMNPNEKCEIY